MSTTANYGLTKPGLTGSADIRVIDANMDIIDTKMKEISDSPIYETATGTATAITLINVKLVNGYPKTFICNLSNGGVTTTINGKYLYKPSTTISPNLIAGKAYEIWYNLSGDCFFIRASAEGTVLASQVLKDATYSTEIDIGLKGTMPNNGAVAITPSTVNQTIALGYHNGSGYVLGDSDLISGNIRVGVNIFGVVGNSNVVDTSVGTVTNNNQLLSSYKCYSKGVLYTGNIPSKSAQTYTPSTVNQTIASGQYLSDVQTILGDSDLIASNILNTANIFNIQGTANPCQKASGTVWCDVNSSVTVSLPFTPNFVAGKVTGAIVAINGYAYNDGTSTFGGGNNDGGVQLLTNGFRFSINRNSNGTVSWYAYLA